MQRKWFRSEELSSARRVLPKVMLLSWMVANVLTRSPLSTSVLTELSTTVVFIVLAEQLLPGFTE